MGKVVEGQRRERERKGEGVRERKTENYTVLLIASLHCSTAA